MPVDDKKNYITRNFAASIVLILVLLTVIPVITVYVLTGAYDEQTRAEISSTSSAISGTVHAFIDGAYSMCYELAVNPIILTMDGALQEPLLVGCVSRNDYLELLFIQDMTGNQTARSSGDLGYRGGRDWFLRIVDEKQPFVSNSYYSIATGMPCTSVFIPMFKDGEMVGVFGADITLEHLQNLSEEFADEQNGKLSFMLDGEGVVIAHPDSAITDTLTNYKTLIRTITVTDNNGNTLLNDDGSVVTRDESISASDDFKAVIERVMQGYSGIDVIEYNGKLYYAAYEIIELPGNSDSWSVITLQERSVALKAVSRLTIRLVFVIILIFCAFIMIAVWFFNSLRKTMAYLENARREAEVANKSKSAFLSTMSHEIRTPMNAVLGITEMQLQNEALSDSVKEAFEKIHSSGNMLLGIINDILDLSKIEAGKLELVLSEYETASMLSDTAQLNILHIGSRQITFEMCVSPELPLRLIGDELRVKQILNNLLSNAFKYTEKGVVKLNVYPESKANGMVCVVFEISDTGQGMTKEQVDHLFDEYTRFNRQANRKTEGTGLGMGITRNLLRLMNGSVTIESEYGAGSLFTARIPQGVVDEAVLGSEVADNLRRFDKGYHERLKKAPVKRDFMPYGKVLIVDDMELNIYVAKGLMSPYGLQIDSAVSGAQAIEKIKNGYTYDIIFMDHMMPEMDGIEATKIIRQIGYTRPIIALTANAVIGQAEIFLNNGFDDFISKPIDMRRMNVILNKYVRDNHKRGNTESHRGQAGDALFAEAFVRDAKKAITALEAITAKGGSYDEHDKKVYTVLVHGMKSALANITEKELSQNAARLEALAAEGSMPAALSETPAFINALKEAVKRHSPAADENIPEQDDD